MKGYNAKGPVTAGVGSGKKIYDIVNWNPLLIAVLKGHLIILDTIFEHESSMNTFHIINCLSKPYDPQS